MTGPRSATAPVSATVSRRLCWRRAWLFALVFTAVFFSYWPTLSGQFIWNDSDYVTATHLRSVDGLGRIWTELGATEQYYPLLHSAFWVQGHVFGDNPTGYHVVTLLLHATGACLFALVLLRLAVPGAWLAALLFALHPVHVESVAWITEQKNTLSLVLYLAAALAYLRYDETRRTGPWLVGLVLFFLSLLSKTVTATLPAALLVIFWWKRGTLEWRRDLRPMLPWLALGSVWALFTSWVEHRYLGAHGGDFDLGLVARGLVAGRAVWFYLCQLVLPTGLNFIYPRWTPNAAVWWQWLFPAGLLALTVVLWRIRGRSRAPLAVLLLFVGALVPVLGFVNLYGALYSFVWDHWQYQADLAPLALVASGVVILRARLTPLGRLLVAASTAVVLATLGLLSWRHTAMFHDNHVLFTTTIARNPNCWMAYNNLSAEQLMAKNFPEALAFAEAAARLNPLNDANQCNLGLALGYLGRKEEALACFREAVRLSPENVRELNNLAGSFMEFGRPGEALPNYQKAVKLSPTLADARNGLGLCLLQLGRADEGLQQLNKAVRLEPTVPAFQDTLGQAWMAVGRADEAAGCFRAAVRLAPQNSSYQSNLGIALSGTGHADEAMNCFNEAVRLAPENASAYLNLGIALRSTGRMNDAQAHFARAHELDPSLQIPDSPR